MLNTNQPGAWQTLFPHAMALMREMRLRTRPDAPFTFGGGTVLMRGGHL
jgi:hypothetical protein